MLSMPETGPMLGGIIVALSAYFMASESTLPVIMCRAYAALASSIWAFAESDSACIRALACSAVSAFWHAAARATTATRDAMRFIRVSAREVRGCRNYGARRGPPERASGPPLGPSPVDGNAQRMLFNLGVK